MADEQERPPLRPDAVRPRPYVDPVHGRTVHPVDPTGVREGDIMRVIDRDRCVYGRVKRITPDCNSLTLENILEPDLGDEVVNGHEKIAGMTSADYYAETVKVSRTLMSDILVAVINKPLTVFFVKQDGQERLLRGYSMGGKVRMGRSNCVDLECKPDDNIRQADHRTLKYLITGGVRYELKP